MERQEVMDKARKTAEATTGRRYKDRGTLPKRTQMRSQKEMYRGDKTGPTQEHSENFERLPGTYPSRSGDSVS
jgi:hypothetical protein